MGNKEWGFCNHGIIILSKWGKGGYNSFNYYKCVPYVSSVISLPAYLVVGRKDSSYL